MKMSERFFQHRNIFLAALIIGFLVGVISWIGQSKIANMARAKNASVLIAVVEITHQAVKSWFKEEKAEVYIWANNPKLRQYVEELLSSPKGPIALASAPAQANLRAWLEPVISAKGYRGFFIIGPKGINLASTRDSNLGLPSLLLKQERFLKKIWSGLATMSTPQPSDVPLRNQSGRLVSGVPTMFVGAPVQNEAGDAIAVLAFRIDPNADFTAVMHRGRIGTSGETYAFDSSGQMISQSRFKRQLVNIGLIAPNSHATPSIDIRDPGVNLVKGEKARLPREQQPLTRMAKSAVAGESSVDVHGYRDYRGISVVGAWIWDDELNIGMASEMDFDEAYAGLGSSQTIVTLATIVLVLLISGLAIVFVRGRVHEKAEQAIEERRRLLRDVLENVSQGVVMFDANKKLQAWNHKIEKDFQFPDGAFSEGQPHSELVYIMAQRGDYGEGDPREIANKRVERLWGDDAIRNDVNFCNDTTYDVTAQRTQTGGLVITYTDITQRKKAESKIADQRDNLEILNQQKNRLFSIIAHDLRNPFTALLGYTEILSTKIDNLSPEKIVSYSQSLNEASTRVIVLMENLLEWSRSQMNQVTFEPTPQDICELAQQSVSVLGMVADEKGIDLKNQAEPVVAMADRNMTDTVIRNLVSNAIKFTPENGQVIITAERNSEWVDVKVSDTGVGMNAKKMNGLFKLETNQSTPGTRGEAGTGLGLLLCKEFVERQGGMIRVESAPGKGSSFHFTLPLVTDIHRPEHSEGDT